MNEAVAQQNELDSGRNLAVSVEETDLTWRVLGTLNVFRLLVSAALISLFFAGDDPRFFGDRYPELFAALAAGYLVFAVVSGLAIRQRWLRPAALVTTQMFADIGAIVILMHASGGIGSGLGGLLIVFVGASSLVLPERAPPFFAAVATIAILAEQVFSQLGGVGSAGNYSAAGVLGAIIFAIALTARPLGGRIQASEALARQRGVDLANLSELNNYIVQHLRESIVVIDTDDEIRLINGSAAQLLGAKLDCTGHPLGSVSGELAGFVSEWRLDGGRRAHKDLTVDAADSGAGMTAHLAPLGRDDRRDGPVLIFLEDTSLMNARVQQSKLASLGRLSASIAHEIRNPVGAMSHAGQLLAESESMRPDDLRLTEIIRGNAERVSHIIDNVLQLSRRESSQPQTLNLRPWLNDFVAEFVRTLELNEGELAVAGVPENLDVRMDPSHLRQVLWNLCDNAVKYASETGGICVELRAGRTPQNNRPYLEVLDQGHGVDPNSIDKIFEPFYTDKQRRHGFGTLYIAGALRIESGIAIVCHPRDGRRQRFSHRVCGSTGGAGLKTGWNQTSPDNDSFVSNSPKVRKSNA